MPRWASFPFDARAYQYSRPKLRQLWERLHRNDVEPWPTSTAVQRAWQLFHAGSYREAVVEGLKVGGAGLTCANKAQALYANYLARDERDRLALWLQVAVRAREQRESDPAAFNAWFFEAYALGRYAQQSGAAQALRLAPRIRRGFEETLRLAPAHASAHAALAVWHTEVIDRVGRLIARRLGASGAEAVAHFERSLALHPDNTIGLVEWAGAWPMLEGRRRLPDAEALLQRAVAITPLDATEALEGALARSTLED